jgi:hypothetical protein
MQRNFSISDLEHLSRQQLWTALMELGASADLADWVIWRLSAVDHALQKAQKQIAALEDERESWESG